MGLSPHSQRTSAALDRRRFLTVLGGAALAAGFIACGSSADSEEQANDFDETSPLPTAVPQGARISINDGSTAGQSQQLRLKLAGLLNSLPFEVSEWTNLRGGPEVINGFRAGSVDLASNAGIPPIQAHYIGGIDPRIVGLRLNRKPVYAFVTRPGSDIQTSADFRGKRLAFSEGQAQGIVMLRAVKAAGLELDDVELVNLPSVQFVTALQSRQVDVAPVGIGSVYQYLNQYEQDGARAIETDVVDLLSVLWAPGRVFDDETKVAAMAAYVPIWAQAAVWEHEHPETWIEGYYVKQEGLSPEQGQSIVDAASKPVFPVTWHEAIAWGAGDRRTHGVRRHRRLVRRVDAVRPPL
jgi:sulfonate transport system substrate-binding protein